MIIRETKKTSKKRWMLDLGTICGKRQRLFYETEQLAIDAMKARKEILKHRGEEALALPLPVRSEYMAAEERLKKIGATIMDAVIYFESHRNKFHPKPLSEAVDLCIAAKVASGKREIYTKALKRSLDSLAAHCGAITADRVTQSQIEEWARSVERVESVSLATVRSRLIDAKTLFNFCLKRKWIVENPCLGIETVQLEETPPGLHTVEDVKTLLECAKEHDPALLGYICPIYFGGLRPSESLNLTAECVHRNHIEVQGPKGKSRRTRFVKINSTLRKWLAMPGVKFGMTTRSRRLQRVRRFAKVPWPQNVLRHTFCSYAMEKFGAKETAASAGHSETMLFARYREKVKPDAAKKFWALRP